MASSVSGLPRSTGVVAGRLEAHLRLGRLHLRHGCQELPSAACPDMEQWVRLIAVVVSPGNEPRFCKPAKSPRVHLPRRPGRFPPATPGERRVRACLVARRHEDRLPVELRRGHQVDHPCWEGRDAGQVPLSRCKTIGFAGSPVWSPDGKKIAIITARAFTPGSYVMDVAGGHLAFLTSADGRAQSYVRTEDASWQPQLRPRRPGLASRPPQTERPAWGTDNERILMRRSKRPRWPRRASSRSRVSLIRRPPNTSSHGRKSV